MHFERPSKGSRHPSDPKSDGVRGERFGSLEQELDRRENAERGVEDVRGVDFSVFLLLGLAVLILIGVVVVIVL